MRRLLFFILVLLCLSSCHRERDKVLAQVYYHKLYMSEIMENMPKGLSPEDSAALVKGYIDSWIREQLVLHEAEKSLSVRDKNFDRKMEAYRNSLLVNAYYEKIFSDTSLMKVTSDEVDAYLRNFDKRYTIEKEIVRVNYVKLFKNSRMIEPVRAILSNEDKRVEEKGNLEKMLGDSVEYMLDDDAWLYLDDILAEVEFDVKNIQNASSQHQFIEKEVGSNHYLIVILDYKNKRSVTETEEEQAAARMMLLNQRRQQYLKTHVDELYQKAVKEGAIVQ